MRYILDLKVPRGDTRVVAVVEEADDGAYYIIDHKLRRGMPLNPKRKPLGSLVLPEGANSLEDLAEGASLSAITSNGRPGGELDRYRYLGHTPYSPSR